ncbi:MAG: hypothetical protein RJA25_1889 [Bacteroidota bacterium]|jgi:hypothetical protein
MKKSYNLIKASSNNILHELKGTYKKIEETRYPILFSLQKADEPNRYGEKVWMKEQVENYVKWVRLSRQGSFNADSIDSGYNSSTYSKNSFASKRASISVNDFQSIWRNEGKINSIEEEPSKKIFNLML